MNLKIKVNNQVFDVKIENVHERPIIVEVEGTTFEVWPEAKSANPLSQLQRSNEVSNEVSKESHVEAPTNRTAATDKPAPIAQTLPKQDGAVEQKLLSVRAPIPGVITSIGIHVGSEVTVGQELCKLEAMKMNNSIRANHNGVIAAIHVSIGQHVKHNDVLMEYQD